MKQQIIFASVMMGDEKCKEVLPQPSRDSVLWQSGEVANEVALR